jgi:hypothetical protein
MNRILEFVGKHWIGIIIAMLIGLIIAGPNLIFINSSSYQGIPIMESDFEMYYLARENATYRGCIMSCNPFIKEYQSQFPFWDPSISEAVLASPGMILSISVVQLKLIYDFLLPAILTFLIYLFAYRLTKTVSLSVLCALFIVLGFNLINSYVPIDLSTVFDMFKLKIDSIALFPYARPVNPQFSSIIFFIYLHILLSCFRRQNIRWFIALAIIYVFAIYTYFYLYTFLTVVNGISILIFLIIRQYKTSLYLLLSTIVGAIFGLPVILEVYRTVTHPYYPILPSNSIFHTHIPQISLSGITLLCALFVIAFFYRQKISHKISIDIYFLLSLIFASFVILNQQIITGIIVQSFHYHLYYATPILVLSLGYLCYLFIRKETLQKYYLLLIIIGIFPVLNALFIQENYYDKNLSYTLETQNNAPILSWLSSQIPKDAIIISPNSLVSFISVFTPHYLILAPSADLYLHEPMRNSDEVKMMSSSSFLKKGIVKYGVNYIITEMHNGLNKLPFDFDIQLALKGNIDLVYKDSRFFVYKVHI